MENFLKCFERSETKERKKDGDENERKKVHVAQQERNSRRFSFVWKKIFFSSHFPASFQCEKTFYMFPLFILGSYFTETLCVIWSMSESPKKIMYPSSSKGSLPPKAHSHMPKASHTAAAASSTLPKVHASQNLPNISSSHINPHQYYSLRWNNYQK